MDSPWAAVIALRLLLPVTILRWPLVGGVIAFLADTFDVMLLDRLGVSDYGPYNAVNKALDTYYLLLEAWVCLGWQRGAAKTVALTLFVYRLIGAALYELTGERLLLLLFPNFFEAFFLTYLLVRRVAGSRALTTTPQIVALTLLLLAPRLAQEYILHAAQLPVYAVLREWALVPMRLVT